MRKITTVKELLRPRSHALRRRLERSFGLLITPRFSYEKPDTERPKCIPTKSAALIP